jgi:ribosome maturation factor RimP
MRVCNALWEVFLDTLVGTDVVEDKVVALALPVVEALGLELADVEYVTEEGQQILRVTINKVEGITVDDCADVSHELSTIFDVDDIVPQRYTLEVSSPGLDRRLKKRKDFLDAVGKKIKLKTKLQVIDRRNFNNVTLEAVGDDSIEVKDIDDRLWTIEFDNIVRVRLEIVL